MAADGLIALATLLVALVYMAGYEGMGLLLAVAAVRAAGTGIQTPAIGALVPQITPEKHLFRVNGIQNSIQSAVTLLSPMLSAVLLTTADLVTIFWVDVVTAAIAISMVHFFLYVRPRRKPPRTEGNPYFADMRAGMAYVRNHRYLRLFFLFSGCFLFLAAPCAFLTPLQVTRSFGGEVWRLSAIEIAFSAGMMVGGILMSLWSGLRNKVYTMVLSNTVVGVGTFLLGVVTSFSIYLAVMVVLGIALPLFQTPSNVLLQERVEESYLGRVYGLFTMLTMSTMPLRIIVFGPLSDLVPIEWMLVVTGALIVVLSGIMLTSKPLIAAGDA